MLIVQFPPDFPLMALIEFAAEHSLVVRRAPSEILTFSKMQKDFNGAESPAGVRVKSRQLPREA